MRSIRTRLQAGMMILIVIMLILLWLFQIVFLESMYENMRVSDTKKAGEALLQYRGEAGFQDRLDEFAYRNNLTYEYYDASGRMVFSAQTADPGGHMPMMMMNSHRIAALKSAMEGSHEAITLAHPRFGGEFMLISFPVKASDGIAGAVLMTMPMAPVEETVAILKRQLLYVTAALLASAIIVSYFLSRSFTKPILKIKNAAETMSRGDFSVRIRAVRKDEIGRLAETINNMGGQLSQIEQLRKDLIANVSHELRTPLSLIRGYAETIRDVTGEEPEKRDGQIEIIIEETERLSRIVDDMLNLSQLQSGYARLRIEPFPVSESVRNVAGSFGVAFEKASINLVLEVPGIAQAVGDRGRIEQVLFNLAGNALNHTPPGGTISIRVHESDNKIRISVCDTGSGIPEVDLPRIWDRYYKSEVNRQNRSYGTGLGLAIVKGILDAHGAAYGVESARGKGSTFWFELKSV